jgi:flagellar biogenesis protein FliO
MSALRSRLDGLPLDRAPLRRAGLLAVLLVTLLAAGTLFGPDRAAALAPPADRQEVLAHPEPVSAPRPATGWTGGRVIALLLLGGGGVLAVVLRRRRAPSARGRAAMIDVIETHPLGPGQTLHLVACGEEVLLLCVGGEQTRLLRHWPHTALDAGTASFADALALAASPDDAPEVDGLEDAPDWLTGVLAAASPTDEDVLDEGSARPAASPLPTAEGQPQGRRSQGEGRTDRGEIVEQRRVDSHISGARVFEDGAANDDLATGARSFPVPERLAPPASATAAQRPAPVPTIPALTGLGRAAGLPQFGGV